MFSLLQSSISAHSSQVGFRWRCREGGEPHISPIDRATEISVYFTLVGYKQIHAWECLTITNYGNYSLLLTAFMFLSLCCMFYWSSLNLTALSRSYYHGWLVNGEGGLDRWSIWKVGVKEGFTHTVCCLWVPGTSSNQLPLYALPYPSLSCPALPYPILPSISVFFRYFSILKSLERRKSESQRQDSTFGELHVYEDIYVCMQVCLCLSIWVLCEY